MPEIGTKRCYIETVKNNPAINAIAIFEALKGTVVLFAASGLTLLVHKDVHAIAVQIVAHTHLNPASHYPRIFIDAADHLQSTHLLLLALGAASYSALRLIEAYGLFRQAAWAEVLAAFSGAVYVPFEIANLVKGFSWLGVAALTLNVIVVAIMVAALWHRRKSDSTDAP